MDITTIIGIIIGILSLVLGYIWDDGHLGALFVPSAALIVFGGTVGAVIISFPMHRIKQVPKALKTAFTKDQYDPIVIIQEIVKMSTIARREGVLALEHVAAVQTDDFLRNGLLMVVDGTDPELTRQILELEIDGLEHEQDGYAKVFESAGGFAPTMGIIGTVMGLIHVLSNLSDPSKLGPAIAVAFAATLYGVVSANLIYLPIANKIKVRNKEQSAVMELMLEGILALQAGENSGLIQKKLESFVRKDRYDTKGIGGEQLEAKNEKERWP